MDRRTTAAYRIRLLSLGAVLSACLTTTARGDAVPPEWLADERAHDLFYVTSDSNVPAKHMPAIGNGFLATQIGGDTIYVAGVYNGAATEAPSHRARIPSTINFRAPGTPHHAALNLREATYYRRSYIPPYKNAG